MKSLLLGILFIVLIGLGGLVYRNAIENRGQSIACPLDIQVCPDSTSVARTGPSCTFPVCPLPNVLLSDVGIAFALPEGFVSGTLPDAASVASYLLPITASSTMSTAEIVIRRYAIEASSTALATIQQTAIGGASGLPVAPTSFTSSSLGTHRFTIVPIERFEGVVTTAYYLARETDVLRFDAIDREVPNWTNPNLDTSKLPARAALEKLLTTL